LSYTRARFATDWRGADRYFTHHTNKTNGNQHVVTPSQRPPSFSPSDESHTSPSFAACDPSDDTLNNLLLLRPQTMPS